MRSPGRTRGRGARGALAAACLLAPLAAACAREGTKYPEVRALEGSVSVVTADIPAGEARFFTYRGDSGRTADFFVYRESGGTARAALDACRTCARFRKGYRLEDGWMHCIYCGMRFELDALANGSGSCVPIALPLADAGDRARIAAEALEEGLRYF